VRKLQIFTMTVWRVEKLNCSLPIILLFISFLNAMPVSSFYYFIIFLFWFSIQCNFDECITEFNEVIFDKKIKQCLDLTSNHNSDFNYLNWMFSKQTYARKLALSHRSLVESQTDSIYQKFRSLLYDSYIIIGRKLMMTHSWCCKSSPFFVRFFIFLLISFPLILHHCVPSSARWCSCSISFKSRVEQGICLNLSSSK